MWQVPLLAVQEPQDREASDCARLPESHFLPGVEERMWMFYCTGKKTMNVSTLPNLSSGR